MEIIATFILICIQIVVQAFIGAVVGYLMCVAFEALIRRFGRPEELWA